MPTVLRLDGLRVMIYVDDHRPAHVHVIAANGEAVFVLNCPDGPPELRERYGVSLQTVNRIQKELAVHLPVLAQSGERFMDISEQEFQAATLRGEELRRKGHAVRAEYDARQKRLVVDLNTGVTIMVPVHLIEELSNAPADDLAEIEITPAGLALHWPRLDAHVYVPGLMQGIYGTRRWMAAQLGAAGGSVTSSAKAAAARENGRKGGRPRKQA